MYKRAGRAARWLLTCACTLSVLHAAPRAQAQDVGSEATGSTETSPVETATEEPSADEAAFDEAASDEAFNEAAFNDAAFSEAGSGSGDSSFDQPAFTVNGMLRMQGGVFAPLMSSKFKPHETLGLDARDNPCDVRIGMNECVPIDHGQKPGSLSIARTTLQLEAHWNINEFMGLHAIVRGVRSLKLPGDVYARPPVQDLAAWRQRDFEAMGSYAQEWAHENLYTEMDLREFYLDLFPVDWLSMRIGRQQVMWGDIAGYRILDQVNPENTTWHFGSLEATEDIRIPLWMWLTTLEMPSIDHTLELLWIPGLDRPKDMVNVPLSFSGAWGIPYTNAPTSFFSPNLNFKFPGGNFRDQRAGLRWKGNVGNYTSYSLQYLYSHQISPPVPTFAYYRPLYGQDIDPVTGLAQPIAYDNTIMREVLIEYPRLHIVGFSLEQNIPALATIARLEASVEPNRVYAGDTRSPVNIPSAPETGLQFRNEKLLTVKYAVQLQRPVMIRFLNPTQNFLIVAQFLHTFLPTYDMDDPATRHLVHVLTYNQWQLQKHHYTVALLARTQYLNGRITLEMKGAYLPNPYAGDSGFYTIDVGYRIGPHYRLNIRATDFVGKDPYRDLGLYRDRDELGAAFTVLF